jgi:hypothetical protein
MADRSVALTTIKGGINRMRTKGAALSDALYDLLNGYQTTEKTVKVRPGTQRYADLPVDTAGNNTTHGLCAFDGSLHVFATELLTVPTGFTCHVIQHPDGPDSGGNYTAIRKIHYAAPFLGYLYVVAEFVDDSIYHYWLRSGDEWQASTIYKAGDLVVPTTPTGLVYQAKRADEAKQSWAPGVVRTIGDWVEPTTYNDYEYLCVDTQGANPRSGDTEPTWPTSDGQQVYEDADGSVSTTPDVTEQPDLATLPGTNIWNRYFWK